MCHHFGSSIWGNQNVPRLVSFGLIFLNVYFIIIFIIHFHFTLFTFFNPVLYILYSLFSGIYSALLQQCSSFLWFYLFSFYFFFFLLNSDNELPPMQTWTITSAFILCYKVIDFLIFKHLRVLYGKIFHLFFGDSFLMCFFLWLFVSFISFLLLLIVSLHSSFGVNWSYKK